MILPLKYEHLLYLGTCQIIYVLSQNNFGSDSCEILSVHHMILMDLQMLTELETVSHDRKPPVQKWIEKEKKRMDTALLYI